MSQSERLVFLSPSDVDASGDWLFWAEPPDEGFRNSIAELGQLEPVLIAEERGGPRLVAGYKRLLACRELDIQVSALAMGNPDPVTRGRMYAESNRQRQPDPADLVRAGRFFVRHLGEDDLSRELRGMASDGGGSRTPDLVRSWLRLDPNWDRLLRAGHIPLRAAETLSRLESGDAAALWPFFRDLRWSRNNALQFLSWLQEAAFRERASLAQLIRSAGLTHILEQDLSPKDRIRRLMNRAREVRYPRLTAMEAEFADLVREASRAGPWRIAPEGSFESDRVHLSASLGSPRDLDHAVRELERLQHEGVLERIREWQQSRLGGLAEGSEQS